MQNKTAVITGTTSGIGEAYARKFAQQGYDLVITGRRKEIIEVVATQIRQKFNVKVNVILAELSEKEGIKTLTDFMKEKKVEVLVNNAGFDLCIILAAKTLKRRIKLNE